MMPSKKGHASMIIAAMPEMKGKGKSDDDSDDEMDEAKMAAADELLAAFKGNDASALAAALDDYMECCGKY